MNGVKLFMVFTPVTYHKNQIYCWEKFPSLTILNLKVSPECNLKARRVILWTDSIWSVTWLHTQPGIPLGPLQKRLNPFFFPPSSSPSSSQSSPSNGIVWSSWKMQIVLWTTTIENSFLELCYQSNFLGCTRKRKCHGYVILQLHVDYFFLFLSLVIFPFHFISSSSTSQHQNPDMNWLHLLSSLPPSFSLKF